MFRFHSSGHSDEIYESVRQIPSGSPLGNQRVFVFLEDPSASLPEKDKFLIYDTMSFSPLTMTNRQEISFTKSSNPNSINSRLPKLIDSN